MSRLTKMLRRRRAARAATQPEVQTPAGNAASALESAARENAKLAHYVRSVILPRPTDTFDQWVPSRWIGLQGIELNEAEQIARVEKWRGKTYQDLYRRLRNDESINTPFHGESYLGRCCLHNGWYPTPDAEIYASMIHDFRPDRIVEVGSGFSTLIARQALTYAALDAPLTVIDPAPRTSVEHAADQVIYERVEDSKLDQIGLTEHSLLFIDSSHITRPRGDVPHLCLEVLPRLPAGTVVHFHDIFIPYDYPTCYDHLCWTEQYVVQALLANSTRYRTLLSTQYMTRHHTATMQRTFGPMVGTDNLFFGASYWIQVC